MSFLLTLTHGILLIMLNTEIETTEQLSVFERQFQQFINRNPLTSCESHILIFSEYEVVYDKTRIVKRPGYEILLENVEAAQFICSRNLELHLQLEGIEYHLPFEIP